MKKDRYGLVLDKYATHVKILKLLGPNPGKVLDAGCASGYLGSYYRRLGADYLVGLELDRIAARKAKRHFNKVFVIDLNRLREIKSLPLKRQSFDTLVCANILEHLVDPLATLKELAKYLRPNGQLIASLPNVTFFMERFKILLGKFDYDSQGGIMDNTHLKFFNRQTAIELVKNAGFEILEVDHARLGKLGWFPWFPNFFGTETIIKARKI